MTTTADRLAIDGGTPVRDTSIRPWPQWPIYDAADEQALLDVLHSGQWWYVEGRHAPVFEQEFAAYQDARYGVLCTNGTAALEIALRALGVGCGDEVIVPPYTFIATATAVLQTGATPIFADIDGETLNVDPVCVEAAVTPRTRAVIAVHIAGRPADMDGVLEIARRHGLAVIEDAAQAHGAAWRGVKVGALGDLGTFSFQATKNLNAGEGGILISNHAHHAEAAWSVMNVGRTRNGQWYEHSVLGSNFRITEFQAALLRAQIQRLPEQTACRTANAGYLRTLLSALDGVRLPADDPRITCHAFHLFTFRYSPHAFGGHTLRHFLAALNAEGIPCSSGYGPLYKEGVFARLARREGAWCRAAGVLNYPALRLPVCESVCADCVWLPQTVLLGTRADMEEIATAIARIRTAFRHAEATSSASKT